MKNFVKENWYKLMVGSSMMMASFGFMIYAISPAYSNNNVEIPSRQNTTSPVGSNGVIVGDYVYFVDGGYVYRNLKDLGGYWKSNASTINKGWEKHKLP